MNLASEEQAKRIFRRFSELEAEISGLRARVDEALAFQGNAIAQLEALIEDQGRTIAKAYGMAMAVSGGPPEPED